MTPCCKDVLRDRPAMPGHWLWCPGCGERWEARAGQWIINPMGVR